MAVCSGVGSLGVRLGERGSLRVDEVFPRRVEYFALLGIEGCGVKVVERSSLS